MNQKGLAAFKRLAPPAFYDLVKARFGTRFDGNYATWLEAKADCVGYDSAAILERVAESTRKVVSGRAAAERDGVLLDRVEYSWPVLASLLYIACQQNAELRVVDFGGALGSTYRQNRGFLAAVRSLKWAVVEQASFVALGKREFEDGTLRFFPDLTSAFGAVQPNVVLLSSVLQYLEKPFHTLDAVFDSRVSYILLDRTPFIDGASDRLTVQTVSKRVYPGSYPAWFFARTPFLERFESGYELIASFDAIDRANISSHYGGALFKRRP